MLKIMLIFFTFYRKNAYSCYAYKKKISVLHIALFYLAKENYSGSHRPIQHLSLKIKILKEPVIERAFFINIVLIRPFLLCSIKRHAQVTS